MPQKHWRQRDVVIKLEHLNPAIQDVIGRSVLKHLEEDRFPADSIRTKRNWRLLYEIVGGANLSLLIGHTLLSENKDVKTHPKSSSRTCKINEKIWHSANKI